MRSYVAVLMVFVGLGSTAWARTIKVDINGSGEFTSVQAALNVAVAGDVIQVLPGTYEGQINITKNLTVQGSGYETTTLTSNGTTVTMSAGTIKWFAITAPAGIGVSIAAGIVTNCVVRGCASYGIRIPSGSTGIVRSCVVRNNGDYGVAAPDGGGNTASVFNCISWSNADNGFYSYSGLNVSYSNGSTQYTQNNQGNINSNPQFVSENDLHLSPASPSWDKGKPDILDPDGSRSDMGYFGGTDGPIAPVVANLQIVPQPDGTFIIIATGVANY